MYARVASFENSDTSRIDDLIATVTERAETGQDLPDAKRVLMLTDRAAGRMLGITFFESEEAIRRGRTCVRADGQARFPRSSAVGAPGLAIYEAVIDDVADGAQAARVSALEGGVDSIDEGIRFIQQQIVPAASDITGWRGHHRSRRPDERTHADDHVLGQRGVACRERDLGQPGADRGRSRHGRDNRRGRPLCGRSQPGSRRNAFLRESVRLRGRPRPPPPTASRCSTHDNVRRCEQVETRDTLSRAITESLPQPDTYSRASRAASRSWSVGWR